MENDIELPRGNPNPQETGFEEVDKFVEKYPDAITFRFDNDGISPAFGMTAAQGWAGLYYENNKDKITFVTTEEEVKKAHDDIRGNQGKTGWKNLYIVSDKKLASNLKNLMTPYCDEGNLQIGRSGGMAFID